MLEFFRRHRGAFLITLTVIIIVSFSFWSGWRTDATRAATASPADKVLKAYGNDYTVAEIQRMQRLLQATQYLQMGDLGQGLQFIAQSPETQGADEVINLIILQEEMKRLKIHPSEAEARAELESLPSLQENGKFSPQQAYSIQSMLGMFGLDGDDMLELARFNIGFRKIQELIAANYEPSPLEVEKIYAQRQQTLKIQTVDFKLEDFKKTVEVKDEDLQKYYDEHKEEYKSEAKRAVSYVVFEKPQDLDKKTPEERTKLQKELIDRVNAFTNEAQKPGADLAKIAAADATKAKVETLPLFARSTPPDALKSEPALVAAIFRHNKDNQAISDPISAEKGYYLFTVTEEVESKQQELAEVKEKIKETLVTQKAQEALSKGVNEAREALRKGLADKKKFDDLAKELKLTASPVRELTIAEPAQDLPNAFQIAREGQNTAAGEVTKALDTDTGALLVYVAAKELRKRDDSANLRKDVAERVSIGERRMLFGAWFNRKREEAKVTLLNSRNPAEG